MFITLDLCCARTSNESLEFLDLYPQELAHRSIYEFILPGEEGHIAKVHRNLLENITQQHQHRIPNNPLRTTSDAFHSTPAKKLMDIANGSQTFKHVLKFRRKENEYQEMNASFYLGGGLGADLMEPSTLDRLYIVCILSPTVIPEKKADVIHLPSLLLLNDQQQQHQQQQQQQQEEDHLFDILSSSPTNSYSSLTNSYHSFTSPLIEPQPISISSPKLQPEQEKQYSKNKQSLFVHPHELYYFQTTSSRLSSESAAHTKYPYLSSTNLVNTNIQFSPLAKFNHLATSLSFT
jgi:hypothetical protein